MHAADLLNNSELIKQGTFLNHGRQPEVISFTTSLAFTLPDLCCFKYIFTSRDDLFEYLAETNNQACEMFTSGSWL